MAFLDYTGLARFKARLDELFSTKANTVANVSYDTTNKKIQETINGTTSDVVTASTLKTDMALNNVENKSSATIRSEITAQNISTSLGYTPMDAALKGANSGVAELGADGKVPVAQVPELVTKMDVATNAGTTDQILRKNSDGTHSWGAAATGTEISSAVNTWMDSHISQNNTVALDDSLTQTGAAAQAKAAGDMIMAKSTQPTETTNKLWFDTSGNVQNIQVPTNDEFETLKSALNIERDAIYYEESATQNFVQGSIADNGGNTTTTKAIRSYVFQAKKGSTIIAPSGYILRVAKYNSSDYSTTTFIGFVKSTYSTEVIIDEDCWIRICVINADTVSDVSTSVGASVTISLVVETATGKIITEIERIYEISDISTLDWERKTINSDGSKTNSTTRIASEFVYCYAGSVFECDSGYGILVGKYSKPSAVASAFIGFVSNNWSNKIVLNVNCYVSIAIRKSDDSTIDTTAKSVLSADARTGDALLDKYLITENTAWEE